MTLILGILLALACAMATNVGFLFKHRGACQAPAVDYRHPLRTAKALFTTKTFAVGFAIATGAWIFHVAAMSMAPLSIVQSVLAGGVVLLAIMAERTFGLALSRRQWTGIAERHHGLMLGASAGLMFAASDVAIKAISGEVAGHGLVGLFSAPMACAVFASIAAFYASAKGLQDGDAVCVIAVTGTGANVGGILGGIVVFGDPLSGHPLMFGAEVFAFALVLVAAWLTPAPLRAAGPSAPVPALAPAF